MMNAHLQLFLVLSLAIVDAEFWIPQAFQNLDSNENEQSPIWAVLVAGSNGWTNYRHQADVCHAYHILRAHGIPEERIITMMYDDIANAKFNPYPGKIFNRPHGKNVYEGVKIDYTGKDVNPTNFLAVLSGNISAIQGGNGRVVESNETDNVFVFFSDHGAEGLISFPADILTAKALNVVLKQMYENGKFRKLVFYLEACESGSMFNNILSTNTSVYAVTAANTVESSWACFCDNDMKLPCLGDLFSVSWMEDTEEEDVNVETLKQQYDIVKKETNASHVQHYGDLKVSNDHVGEFVGWENSYINSTSASNEKISKKKDYGLRWKSHDVTLMEIYHKIKRALSVSLKISLKTELSKIKKKREYFKTFMRKFVKKITGDFSIQKSLSIRNPRPITDFDCHDDVVRAFNDKCFNFGKNPYALEFVYMLTNMCEANIEANKIIKQMETMCYKTLYSIR